MNTKLIFLLVATVVLSGCDTGTPKCNSEDARNLVINIAQEQIDKQIAAMRNSQLSGLVPKNMGALKLSVTNVRTMSHDSKLGIYQCAADLEFSTNDKRLPITYSIQKTDDSDGQFYINVYGL
ncbi:hypothetical protein N0H69_15460 [Yersinia alsatica]|uniref:Lipoprotein n=1 Tax=Yersinia alsatica TaxID=2890317 RepID=A0ABY5UQE4_9GAMM|nr:hypothetical protein [Yersinia alsatica]OWF68622.1 hypothetical protein B4901_12145 [Yersinia frederiksenii]UWM44088.1 hypothetical protein N0H69_15460 [Yersinia alsatica]CNK95521.1 Uncharacterised protein [Yersinia frederiksenii]CNL12327.1 Uncharacterised protein [Yersinia frederiksenii]